MVELTRIYTKGGDKGKTSLGSGARVAKYDIRVSAYGTVDEANAVLGLVRLHSQEFEIMDALLSTIQNDLFDIGADLCTPDSPDLEYEPLRVTSAQTERLEKEIDSYNAKLEPLKSFILPGGSAAASYLHLGRTVVRRAERLVVELAESEEINREIVRYLNRLSDLLFVLSRICNDEGRSDVLWVPGANR